MKTKEKNAIQEMKIDELQKQYTELQQRLVGMRLARYTKQSKNTREMRTIKRKVAIISTVMHQKELHV